MAKDLKLIYSNEANETSLFLHFAAANQNAGSQRLSEVNCTRFSLSLFMLSSLVLVWSTGLLLYSRSKHRITGYGVLGNWLSIWKDDIWKENFC